MIYTLEINSDKSVKDAKQTEDKATCRSQERSKASEAVLRKKSPEMEFCKGG